MQACNGRHIQAVCFTCKTSLKFTVFYKCEFTILHSLNQSPIPDVKFHRISG
jgi:hypothetical protein